MHTFDSISLWSASEAAGWLEAHRAVQDAVDALQRAGVALAPLLDASDWQADGVRRLHVRVGEIRESVIGEIGWAQSRLWELEAVPGL